MLGLLVASTAAVGLLVIAPPVEFLKTQAIAEVKARTGRELRIEGPVTFAVYPALALRMDNVSLSGPPGMAADTFGTASSIAARIKLLPLLQRRIAVDNIVLTEPVFELRVDASGRRNFDFTPPPARASASPLQSVQVAQAGPAAGPSNLPDTVKDFVENASNPDSPSPSQSAKLAALEDLTLGDVRIERGTVHYLDARSGIDETVTAIDASATLTALQNPLDGEGSFNWNGQPVGFDVSVASPRAVLEERPARLKLALKAAPLDARFEGTLVVRNTAELDGDLSAKGPSLRDMMRWLGTELPPGDGFGAASLRAKLRLGPRGVVLNDAQASLDGATASGTLAVEPGQARPKITGNLKVSYVDLNRYSLAAAKAARAGPPVAKPKSSAQPSAVQRAAPKSIEDLIDGASGLAGPKVKGYAARDGWSTESIPLEALGAADAELRIAAGGLRWREIKSGPAIVAVALKSKVLKVNLDEVEFYDGRGRGIVTVDANPIAPAYGANLSADGVTGGALLKDAADFDRVDGKARVILAVGARGQSESELVESLTGRADFAFTNGSVKGINIGGAIKSLSRRQIPNFKSEPSDATEFSELTASFQIDKGIASNSDLRLFSPLLRVTGAGKVALPAQTIDYVLKPRLVASGEGQGAQDKASGDKLAGLEVPLKVRGPLANPAIEPEFGAVLKDPNKAIDAVKEAIKPFKGTGSALIKSLLGKGESNGQAQPPPADGAAPQGQPQKVDPKKLLDSVLGR